MFMNTGRHPRAINSLRWVVENLDEPVILKTDPSEWTERMKLLSHLCDLVMKYISEAQIKQKASYDGNKKHVSYKVGDWVLRRSQKLSSMSKKLLNGTKNQFEL